MEIHFTDWITRLQQFLSKYEIIDEVAGIIHHQTVNCIFHQIKSKYGNNTSTKTIFPFLDTLLEFLRQNIT
jgi:hypothetical protein